MAFPADSSERFATCGDDGTVRVWDLSDYRVLAKATCRSPPRAQAPAHCLVSTRGTLPKRSKKRPRQGRLHAKPPPPAPARRPRVSRPTVPRSMGEMWLIEPERARFICGLRSEAVACSRVAAAHHGTLGHGPPPGH